MRLLLTIFVLFTITEIVKSAFWAAAVQPVILGLGAVFSALDQDVLDVDIKPIDLKNFLPFINKQEETSKDAKTEAVEVGIREGLID